MRTRRFDLSPLGILGSFVAALVVATPFIIAESVSSDGAARVSLAKDQSGDTGVQRLTELEDVVAHEDHAIDILNGQPDKKRLKPVLDQVTQARDEVEREIDELNQGKTRQDVRAQHQRDVEQKREGKGQPSKDNTLQTVMLYVQHDQQILERQQPDKATHRGTALRHLRQAQKELQKIMDTASGARQSSGK